MLSTHFLRTESCLLCGSSRPTETLLCLNCTKELPGLGPTCRHCAATITGDVSVCGRCIDNAPPFTRCVAAFRYGYPISNLIRLMKYRGKMNHAIGLGALMANHIELTENDKPQCLIPVPLHYTRLVWRGYNQSLELAKVLGKRFNINIDNHLCKRVKRTLPQPKLTETERARNVRSAFRIGERGKYRHVAVIDDVMTTGHTVTEISKQLRLFGISRVDVWVCCRAIYGY